MIGRVTDLLLPGARDLRGRPLRGVAVLLAWIGLWALAVLRRDRLLATPGAGRPDWWIALLGLVTALSIVWRAGRPRATGRDPAEPDGEWAAVRAAFARHRLATAGLTLVALLALVAVLTPYLAPYDPAAQGADLVATRFQAPSWAHLMGTDRFGRDVLSRVLYGGRVSLLVGTLAVVIAITLGSLVGAVAGYARGWVDTVSMRTVDLLLSLPRLVLLITIIAFVDPSTTLIIVVLGLTGWMGTSRLVRGEVLSLREREFVQAARVLGFGRARILFRHVLPNVATPIIVAATLGIGNTILVEASLSFLGFGVPPPTPSWGDMVLRGVRDMHEAPWLVLFPGVAIVITVMSFNLVGDGLRDALDPRASREAAP